LPNLGPNLLADFSGKIEVGFLANMNEKCAIPLVVDPLEDADAIAVWREEIDKFRHVCYSYSEPGRWGV
jgi:hypothetical protein